MNFTDMMYEAKNAAAGKANATITSNVNGHMVEAYAHQTADDASKGTYRVSWLVDWKRCKFSDLPARVK